jgi:LysM repeat protein
MPVPMGGAYHTVEDGETLWDIARTYDKTLDEMMRANGWDDDDARSLAAGQRVLVPPASPSGRSVRLAPRSVQTACAACACASVAVRRSGIWPVATT